MCWPSLLRSLRSLLFTPRHPPPFDFCFLLFQFLLSLLRSLCRMLVCILRQMKHTLAQLISEFGLLGLLCSSSAGLAAGDAGSVAVDSRVNSPIAWCDLGAKATAQYSGDGLAITTAQALSLIHI